MTDPFRNMTPEKRLRLAVLLVNLALVAALIGFALR